MTSTQQRAELQRRIWQIANDVRGAVDGWDFKQYVLGTLFYRFISENFVDYITGGDPGVNYAAMADDDQNINAAKDDAVKTKGYFIYPSQLFVNVAAKANTRESLNTDLANIFAAIEASANGYPSEHDIKGLFADFDTTSNRLGNTVKDKSARLAAVLKGVADLDFGTFDAKAKHYLSDADLASLQTITLPAERKIQDYRSTYNDVRDWLRREKAGVEKEKSTIDWDDVIFEVDLLKSQEINLDYILELIFEHNKKIKSKSELVDEVRRVIRASLGNRAKEGLLVDFINQTDLNQMGEKASVIDAFFIFAQAEQKREVQELIAAESLNDEAARRYITTSLKREFASENGTELNAVLPKMSPLNPQYLSKKQGVFQKIAAFVEKFKGVGGRLD